MAYFAKIDLIVTSNLKLDSKETKGAERADPDALDNLTGS